MQCPEILPKLGLHAEGRLSPAEWDQVWTHLRECGDCRAALARADWLAALLLDSETRPIPKGLAKRVVSAAWKQRANAPDPLWHPAVWWQTAPAAIRVAAVLILVIGPAIGASLGWTSAPAITAATTAEQARLLDAYALDSLGEVPAGSLADKYFSLIDVPHEERPN